MYLPRTGIKMPFCLRQISITEDEESPDGRFYFNPRIWGGDMPAN